ncbi:putative RDD family membrane protein YckC [Arthrobacter pascens]|nr:RDD family protein [Arthrobacter pascens]MDQ0634798.1 putative RDD family membrane protein YckC [Arthrobacter pascens]
MAVNLELCPAPVAKRLGAAVLDWLAPVAILVVAFTVGFAGITRTHSGGFIVYGTGSLVLFGGIGAGLTLAYVFVLVAVEGRSGNTIGNRLMGIRSADKDGYAPGAGAVFLRGLVTGAGILLAIVAAIVLAIFMWFDAALLVLGPLVLLGAAWAVLVVVSSTWDKNGGLRGWHDSAAGTLMFDIKAGRNPISTGGIQGPYSFAPLDLPPVQQVVSPVAGAAKAPQVIHAQMPPVISAPQAISPHPAQVRDSPALVNPEHPDDDHDRTQMRGGTSEPVPVAVLRIRLDDGRDFQLDRNVLVGRNPVGREGELQAQLLPVPDPGRTISKTHLHLLTDGAGIWVTDRNSTNGSAVTTPDGLRTPLQPGVPAFVNPGSTVHFGDRSFHVGQA